MFFKEFPKEKKKANFFAGFGPLWRGAKRLEKIIMTSNTIKVHCLYKFIKGGATPMSPLMKKETGKNFSNKFSKRASDFFRLEKKEGFLLLNKTSKCLGTLISSFPTQYKSEQNLCRRISRKYFIM